MSDRINEEFDELDELNIKQALEEIEPSEGARERMLANIKRKAKEAEALEEAKSDETFKAETEANAEAEANVEDSAVTEPENIDNSDKNHGRVIKINRVIGWAGSLAAVAVVAFLAGRIWQQNKIDVSPTEPEESVNTSEPVEDETILQVDPVDSETPPMVIGTMGGQTGSSQEDDFESYYEDFEDYDTAEEVAAVTGFTVVTPENVSDIYYRVWGESIVEVSFNSDEEWYTLYASTLKGDFSQRTGQESEVEIIDEGNGAKLCKVTDEFDNCCYKISWSEEDINYYLIIGVDIGAEYDKQKLTNIYKSL
ncbi:MAG: hypothetical protein K6F92_09455 [Lachnospiraceae bacterium]|nr:hypothetical protein [Lachnospiraceae bacterium]